MVDEMSAPEESPVREGKITAFDEMADNGTCRPPYLTIKAWLDSLPPGFLRRKHEEAELLFRRIGITFSVYAEGGDPERTIPFDIIPRVLNAEEWAFLERGLSQRVRALNAFLLDIYSGREILRAGRIPETLILLNEGFRPEMQDYTPPRGVYTHVSGIDVIRLGPREFCVLEDNCRVPSGASYMLENREAMMRLFPGLLGRHRVAPVSHYPDELLDTLRAVAPPTARASPSPSCSRRASSTAPITSTISLPMKWASRSSRGRISSSRTTSSSCAPPRGRTAWT